MTWGLITAFSLVTPGEAPAKTKTMSMEKILSNGAVQGMIVAIARVNQAMRHAADNPMNRRARLEVQSTIAALPAAIRALAMEFQAVHLPPTQYQAIMGIFGQAVDQNAPLLYQRFLQHPERHLIPKLGGAFPKAALESGSSQVGYDDTVAKSTAAGASAGVTTATDPSHLGLTDASDPSAPPTPTQTSGR